MSFAASPARRQPSCPTCGAAVSWPGNPHRPFCSLVCRLRDLGVWLDEGYRVAGDPLPAVSEGDGSGEPRP